MLLKKRINIILIAFFLFTPYLASAREGYASKENVDCSYCHSNNGPPQLNQVGIYYRNNGYSLQGYNTSAQENTPAEPAVTNASGKYIGKSIYTGDKDDNDNNYIDDNDKIDEDDERDDDELDEISKSGDKKSVNIRDYEVPETQNMKKSQQTEGMSRNLTSDFSVVFSLAGIIAIMLVRKKS